MHWRMRALFATDLGKWDYASLHVRQKMPLKSEGALVGARCPPWLTRFAGTTSLGYRSVSIPRLGGGRQWAPCTSAPNWSANLEHIPTTATAVQKLKRLAKNRRKTTAESLAAALDMVARESGYSSWKHVTVCQAATTPSERAATPLAEAITSFLAEQRAAQPALPNTVQAMASGLVFAMDIKDAFEVRPESEPEIHECDDALAFLAGDIWSASVRRDLEKSEGAGDLEKERDPDELLQEFIDFIGNYRFFRYSGDLAPKSLDDAFSTAFRGFFFPPTHVWISGTFFDMADVPEVRRDGRVVFSTSPVRGDSPGVSANEAGLAPNEPKGQTTADANAPPRRSPFVARLDIRKLQAGLYEYHASYAGQELFSDAGFSSIAEALHAASDVTGDIVGFEVAYAGLVAGTYSVDVLRSTADEVAQRAVDTVASLRHF